jgi:IS5 family transposase
MPPFMTASSLAFFWTGGNTCSKVWADSAYRSADAECRLKESGFITQVHRRGKRGKPLSKYQAKRGPAAPGSGLV